MDGKNIEEEEEEARFAFEDRTVALCRLLNLGSTSLHLSFVLLSCGRQPANQPVSIGRREAGSKLT